MHLKVYNRQPGNVEKLWCCWSPASNVSHHDANRLDKSLPTQGCHQHRLWSLRLPHRGLHQSVCFSRPLAVFEIQTFYLGTLKRTQTQISRPGGTISNSRFQRTSYWIRAKICTSKTFRLISYPPFLCDYYYYACTAVCTLGQKETLIRGFGIRNTL